MSKLANPWKCDNAACGILRANDTNHWLVIYLDQPLRMAMDGRSGLSIPGAPVVCIRPWNEVRAEEDGAKHACGVPCGLKIAAQLVMETFFPAENSSTEKEAADGA